MEQKYQGIDLKYLFKAIMCLETEEEYYKFFDDLCTVQELRAISQRLQVAKMLDENRVYNDIVKETGASTATISRVNRSLHYGSKGYRTVFDRLDANKKKMNSYSAFAVHYDALTQNVNYPQRADYFCELLQRYAPEAKEVLDLACGTGSLTYALVERGYDMIGVDGSIDMLSEAMAKMGEEPLLFLHQQMQELELFDKVDAVICALDSINHLASKKDVLTVFQRVAEYTHDASVFIFDVNTLYKHQFILADNAFVYETEAVYCVWQNEYQTETHQVDISLDFFEPLGKEKYSRQQEEFSEYYYSPECLTELLQQAGFRVTAIFHADTQEPLNTTSQRLVFVTHRN